MKTADTNNENLKKALELAKHTQGEIDKESYYLRSLQDLARELSGLEDIRKIMETFLLMTMGTFGISQGFVLLIDKEALNGQIASRGLEDGDIKMLHEHIKGIVHRYFSTVGEENGLSEIVSHLITKERITHHFFFPFKTGILIQWVIDNKYSGLLGLGEKILSEEYGNIDIEFLISFNNHLIFSLNNAISVKIIGELIKNLHEKNILLEKALQQKMLTEKELDKRIFHLRTLYDTSCELSDIKDTGKVMDTFLLMIMGIFSAVQGYSLLLNKKENTATLTHRGIEKEKLQRLTLNNVEKIISKLFKMAEMRKMSSMGAVVLTDKRLLNNPAISMDTIIGLLFVIDGTTLGIIALGRKIKEESYLPEDQELMITLANSFMVFFKNAKSFEKLQKLNVYIEKKNIELKKTVEELNASKLKIELLEKAKSHVKTVVQKEMERTGRLSIMDLLLILGVGLILGVIFNFINPGGISLIPPSWIHKSSPRIDLHRAKINYDSRTTLFVDARPDDIFKQKHIQGAVNLPISLFNFVYMMKFSNIDPKKEIIVYGKNISRLYDEEVAFMLTSRGHINVKILSGGLNAWQRKGYPLEP